jgi:hypothetical protein
VVAAVHYSKIYNLKEFELSIAWKHGSRTYQTFKHAHGRAIERVLG